LFTVAIKTNSNIGQVYLLTPMDHVTLPHAKSLPHCTPSEITRQQCCEIFLKHIATQTVTCLNTYIRGKS